MIIQRRTANMEQHGVPISCPLQFNVRRVPVNSGCLFRFCLLLLLSFSSPGFATVSLDEVLSCLETNGVLSDRSRAVQGGIEGILKSIDPSAFLGGGKSTLPGDGGVVATQSVAAVELWPEDIAYLKIGELAKGGGSEVLRHLKTFEGKAGVILDFRGAGGSDLESVARLAGLNRREGVPVFVVVDNQDKPLSTNCVESAVSLRTPLMVLVDGRTRHAAEALAALWHGCPGVMLIGSTTSGDARFREVLTLPDGQFITLATRKLIPLQGEIPEGRGIEPDVEVAAGLKDTNAMLSGTNAPARPLSEKSERDRALMRRVDDDAVLRRATDILLGLRLLNGYGQR